MVLIILSLVIDQGSVWKMEISTYTWVIVQDHITLQEQLHQVIVIMHLVQMQVIPCKQVVITFLWVNMLVNQLPLVAVMSLLEENLDVLKLMLQITYTSVMKQECVRQVVKVILS